MKRVLILVLSSEIPPYEPMINQAMTTWDSVDVENTETIYYCGKSLKKNTSKIIYLPIADQLSTMGEKTLQALEWALKNKEFDYIARAHSSCYVDKKQLINHIQELPYNNVFEGIEATSQNGFQFLWGGGHYVISKDVIEKIVENRSKWNHSYMEDESMSVLCSSFGIPFKSGKSCSINKRENDWLLLGYGGESKEFTNFADVKPLNNHFYRVKQDGNRSLDAYIMNELFNNLK